MPEFALHPGIERVCHFRAIECDRGNTVLLFVQKGLELLRLK
jgi:hypothetical protein